MRFEKVGIDLLLAELADLPSEWMDAEARRLVPQIPVVIADLRRSGPSIHANALARLLADHEGALDILRLLTGQGQEPMAHGICDALGGMHCGWSRLRTLSRKEPVRVADALVRVGLLEVIRDQVWRDWTINDVLLDRYKLGRGRAIAGQSRGRGLENAVEAILRQIEVPFETRVTFTGSDGTTAKCDFAIPSRKDPLIVIESKGYEATGSKLTDFLGDVLKIKQAKGYHMYLFVVTDGRGWFNRRSDLKRLVDLHSDGTIEMIYTRARLSRMADDIRQIWSTEQ